MVATVAFALTVSRSLQHQVQRLLEAARRLGTGDFRIRVPTEGNDEFATVVAALEQQYDQLAAMTSGTTGGLADLASDGVPSGDEIAAQVELFLSSLTDPDDPEKQTDG